METYGMENKKWEHIQKKGLQRFLSLYKEVHFGTTMGQIKCYSLNNGPEKSEVDLTLWV